MRKSAALVLAALMLLMLLPPAKAQAATDYSWVRVKLTTNNATTLKFYISGAYFIAESGAEFTGGTLTVSVEGSQMTVTHSADGLLYAGKTVTICRTRVDRTAGYAVLNGRNYLGHFVLKLTSSGYIQVVNHVPMAHYLYGVVGFEMNNLYPIDALKAQAIAAKGYVMNQMSSSGDYDIGDTSSEQVYKGYGSSYTNVMNAVDSTLNEVLTVNGSILRSYFAASNGGETNLPTYAWSGRSSTGYAISIDDYDFANTLSLSEKRRIPFGPVGAYSGSDALYTYLLNLASAQTGLSLNYLDYIYAAQTSDAAYSGCLRNLTRATVTLKASSVDGGGNVLAQMDNISVTFRLSDLATNGVFTNSSLRIYWGEDRGDGYYYFYHVRYGHGVGLSQRGAEQRAKSGQSYQSILAFYYPGATLSYMNFAAPVDPVNNNKLPTGSFVLAVTTGGVNFRKKPDAGSTKITTIPKDTQVNVYGRENGWAYAVYNGNAGYISEDYLKYLDAVPLPGISASPSPGTTPAQTLYSGRVTGSGVNFRSQPSTSSSTVIAKLAKNTALVVYSKTGSWYYVSVGGTPGYISSSYVEITGAISADPNTPAPTPGTTAAPTATVSMPPVLAYGVTIDSVNFRIGPSTSYSVMMELQKGVAVTIYGESGNWYLASNGTLTGYLSKDYVRITSNAAATPTVSATPVPSSAQTMVSVGYINNGNTNFRVGPAVSYQIIRVLDKNTGLYAYSLTGDWYYVLVGDSFGYVHKDYVTITGTVALGAGGKPSSAVDLSGAIGLGVTTGNVNCRSGPGTSYSSYGTLAKNLEVLFYELKDGWYKIKLSDGKIGYVSSKYIKVTQSYTSTPQTNTGTSEGGAVIGEGVTTGAVNFRTGPSSSSKKITQLKKGVTVTLYSLSNGWYEVSYNGTRGYLYAQYVKVTSKSTSTSSGVQSPSASGGAALTLATGKATGTLNFRSAAGTNAKLLSTLKAGETFQILGQTSEWYYVLYGGRTGFVYKAYASVTASGSAGIPTVVENATALSAVTTAQVNLRTSASLSASVIQLLSKGSSATAYLLTDGWYLLNCGGKLGYAVDDYVKVS